MRQTLKHMERLIGHKHTTYDSELRKIGKKLFGTKFKGVFPSDALPVLRNGQCAIMNVDGSKEPGSHWMSLHKHNGKLYGYDSFGRNMNKLVSKFDRVIINDTKDKEQGDSESNCGQRCVAWICMV